MTKEAGSRNTKSFGRFGLLCFVLETEVDEKRVLLLISLELNEESIRLVAGLLDWE
jgi:hypothetical protein